jgi:hypothetical protein
MIPMNIAIQLNGDPPVWQSDGGKVIDAGLLQDVVILESGMQSGRPSVAFRIVLPNGEIVFLQQTARQMVMLARIIEAKFPDVMKD